MISVTARDLHFLAFPDETKAIKSQDGSEKVVEKKEKEQWWKKKEQGVCGGGGGGCAGLLESLPSLVAAIGPAPGPAIHSYQFASCCIFFSLVFHSLTHAILLFKLLKKKTEAIFPRDPLQGPARVGREEKKKNTFSTGRDSKHLWPAGDTVKSG